MSKRARYLRPIQPAFATVVSDDTVWSEIPDNDWAVNESGDNGEGGGGNFQSQPVSPYVGNRMKVDPLYTISKTGWSAYAMHWNSFPLSSSDTIVSATLDVGWTGSWISDNDGGDIVLIVAAHDERNSNQPASASEAVDFIDRCDSSKWDGPDLLDGNGILPSVAGGRVYSVDVKDEIEEILAISGWTADDGMVLMICGVVGGSVPPGPPSYPYTCTGQNAGTEAAHLQALTGSTGLPNPDDVAKLTIVYN